MATDPDPRIQLHHTVRATFGWRFRDINAPWGALHHAIRHFLKGQYIAALKACRRADPQYDGCTMSEVMQLEAFSLRALHLLPREDVLATISEMRATTHSEAIVKRLLTKLFLPHKAC